MQSLPTFWPVFTVLVTVVEVCLLVAVLSTNGFAPIRFGSKVEYDTVKKFGGGEETISKEVSPNLFVGVSSQAIIHCGAMYTPCMRQNIEFQVTAAKNREEDDNLECCKVFPSEQCGMLKRDSCKDYKGRPLGGASACRRELNVTDQCRGNVTLRPCCLGLLGWCNLTTEAACLFQDGYWHEDKVLCGEVGTDCFKDICRFSWIGKTIGQAPEQGIRFLAAMFLYKGIIDFVIVVLLKLYTCWKTEKRIGWLRVFCIYIVSGIGGYLVSGIFNPTSPSVGGSGALFGLYGMMVVELLQGWKWVRRPCVQLTKLIVFIIFLLALGTLPYLDNFSHIGGFVFGVLASFVFVPYITIGKWDRVKKLSLVLFALPVMGLLFLFGFVVFLNSPDPDFCSWCSYLDCIPYTSTFCESFILNIPSSLVPFK